MMWSRRSALAALAATPLLPRVAQAGGAIGISAGGVGEIWGMAFWMPALAPELACGPTAVEQATLPDCWHPDFVSVA